MTTRSDHIPLPSDGISARLAVLGKGIETGNLSSDRYDEMVRQLSKEDANRG